MAAAPAFASMRGIVQNLAPTMLACKELLKQNSMVSWRLHLSGVWLSAGVETSGSSALTSEAADALVSLSESTGSHPTFCISCSRGVA